METSKYILNKGQGIANILIDGEIDSFWGTGLRQMADEISASGAKTIMVQINSPGGSVTEGNAIASFIKGFPAKIDTNGVGLVASIATSILLAGDTSSMSEGSWFMIHNPWSVTSGESNDLRQTADLLDKMRDQLAEMYVLQIMANDKLVNGNVIETREQVNKWMDEETWFTAQEAMDAGFINKVTEGVELLNKSSAQTMYNSCSKFNNVPAEFLNKVKTIAMAESKNEEVQENFFDKVKAWFKTNPDEAKQLATDLAEQEATQNAEEIENAIQIAKDNGFYKETVQEAEVVEEVAEEVISESTSDVLQVENAKLKAALKLAEERNAAPSAGAGKGTENQNKTIQNKIAPTAEHKKAVDQFANLFN
jgi:ATP-dependent Clp protease protease subunit